jgi:hypothetical protein
MRRLCVGAVLLLCSAGLHAQKTRFGQELPFAKPGVDYSLTVHVYGVHVRADCENGYCINVLYADATLNGRKLELRGSTNVPEKPYKGTGLLSFGDFRARVLKSASGLNLGDEYEVVVAGNRVFPCVVSGMVE